MGFQPYELRSLLIGFSDSFPVPNIDFGPLVLVIPALIGLWVRQAYVIKNALRHVAPYYLYSKPFDDVHPKPILRSPTARSAAVSLPRTSFAQCLQHLSYSGSHATLVFYSTSGSTSPYALCKRCRFGISPGPQSPRGKIRRSKRGRSHRCVMGGDAGYASRC